MTAADGARVSRRRVLAGVGAGGVLFAVGGLAACTSAPSTTTTDRSKTDGSFPSSELTQPVEITSQNGRLDATLVAAAAMVPYAGGARWALTYNGTTPGPTLRVRPGDVLTVTLENRLDAPTNLHTHGLHVSPEGDSDNVFVMVHPGQRHTYRYQIPADHPSGTFWYHPHHHGEVARQVFGGMAGVIIVEDAIDALPEIAAATERVLVLADTNIGDSAAVLDVAMMQRMMGREGSTILVNGLLQPRIPARAGTLEHWRIVNASPSRSYALRLDGQPLHLAASDGGRLDAPHAIDELVLVPGERAEVLVPVTAGTHALTTRTVDRGGMGMAGQGGGMGGGGMGAGGMGGRGNSSATTAGTTTVIAMLDATGEAGAAPSLPVVLRDVADPAPGAVTRTREVTLSMAMGMGMGGTGGDGQFLIDGRSFDAERVDITTQLGTTEDWVVRNTSPMDHPFHLHVWPFRVVERSDGAALPLGWKDTVNVPAGQSVRLRIPFRDIPGKAVYHCHILDHEDLGMMGIIETKAP
jgi:FtsP/CotA-like multicopper oxidase with cupredoxin domain